MKPTEEPRPTKSDKDKPPPKPTRSEETLRIIEEYASDLRELIKQLRQRLS